MVAQLKVVGRSAGSTVTPGRPSLIADLTPSAAWAALVAFVWCAFGMLPLQLALVSQLNLGPAQASSSVSVVWIGGALASVTLALRYRQPIAITWTTPGLIYVAAVAPQFTVSELFGANLMAGVLLLILGVTGAAARILPLMPLPVAMGIFAGSMLAYLTRMVRATAEETLVAGATIFGYLLGRKLQIRGVPPMGLAVVCGALAVGISPGGGMASVALVAPDFEMPVISLSIVAFLAITLPVVLLVLSTSQAPALSFLASQGYRVPVTGTTVIIGMTSIVTALFGGYPASTSRDAGAMQAGPEAGPLQGRYWSTLILAVFMVSLAAVSSCIAGIVEVLPSGYIVTLAGLGILSSMSSAVRKAFEGPMQMSALVAFAVSATPFTAAGLPSQFWAAIASLAIAVLLERGDMRPGPQQAHPVVHRGQMLSPTQWGR